GHILIQSQRYEIERAHIVFDGDPEPNPQLDIQLVHEYPEATVIVEVRGTPKKPELELSSDPPIYDRSQIISLLLSGQPGGEPSAGQSFNAEAAVSTMVLGKLADAIAPELGVDVFRVENKREADEFGDANGQTDTRVEVGKYVSPRVYLSYVHYFGASE